MDSGLINKKILKLASLIIGEIFLLVLPPLKFFSNPVVILVIIPGLLIGFFHSRTKSKRGQPSVKKVEKIAHWLGIIFALIFGVFVLIAKGSFYLFEVNFYYGLWQIASFYYGIIWAPYLIGLNAGLKK